MLLLDKKTRGIISCVGLTVFLILYYIYIKTQNHSIFYSLLIFELMLIVFFCINYSKVKSLAYIILSGLLIIHLLIVVYVIFYIKGTGILS